MLVNYNPNLPLYHGTINLYANLITQHGVKIFPRNKGGVDFGPGFYLTTNYNQAKEWAQRRSSKPVPNKQILELSDMTVRDFLEMKKEFQPVILKFEVKSIAEWKKLKYNIFEKDNEKWKHFVWIMRHVTNSLPQYNFDWVYGPVADGGLLSPNFDEIRAFANKDQLAILTNKALNCLEITEVIKC